MAFPKDKFEEIPQDKPTPPPPPPRVYRRYSLYRGNQVRGALEVRVYGEDRQWCVTLDRHQLDYERSYDREQQHVQMTREEAHELADLVKERIPMEHL